MTIPAHVDRAFRALYPTALGDTEDLRRQVAADASLRTLEIADTAYAVAEDAAISKNGQGTFVFSTIACVIYEALGLPEKALQALLPNVSFGFVQAETNDEYLRVASSAQRKAAQAEAMGAPALGMKYRILTADCLYFAATLKDADVHALQQFALKALTETFTTPGATELNVQWTSRARSLIANLYHSGSQRFSSTDDADLLRGLAALAEALIPVAPPAKFDKYFVDHAAWLAQLSYRHGETAIAENRIEAALPLATSLDAKSALLAVRYEGLRGHRPSSLAPLRSSIRELSELCRAATRSRAGRLLARQRDNHTEGLLLDDEATEVTSTDADLFAECERLKARLLLDELTAPGRPPPEAVAKEIARLEESTFALNALSTTNAELRENLLVSQLAIGSPCDPHGNERAAYVAKIEDLCASADASIGVASSRSLAEVQHALGAGEALLQYAIPHFPGHPAPHVIAFAVTRDTVLRQLVKIDDSGFRGPVMRVAVDGASTIDASPLGDAVIACRRAIQTGRDEIAREHLAFLHDSLIRPLMDRGFDPTKFERIVVVPHGQLHYVPFAALGPQGGRHLIEDVALTLAPSASSWLHLRSRAVCGAKSFLGVANPTLADPLLPPLPETEKELKKIVAALPELASTTLVGPDATESAVRAALKGRSIIHFATHGEFPELNALDDHRILLGPGNGNDGKLHARELRQLELSDARLVVLNICNGGLYRVGPGDEPYGLVPALLVAGVENVLGTLWEVEDTSARTFITQVYKALLREGIANALRAASIRTISLGGKLHQWAGFVNIGSGKSIGSE